MFSRIVTSEINGAEESTTEAEISALTAWPPMDSKAEKYVSNLGVPKMLASTIKPTRKLS